MTRVRLVVILIGVALVAAGCGGSDDGDADNSNGDSNTTTTAASNDATTTTVDGTQPEIGEFGSFTVNDTEFAVNRLNRCIPFDDQPGNIDLQALGQRAKLNLLLEGDFTDVSVDGGAIQEMFGSIAFGRDVVVASSEVSGDQWTGSATAGDSTGGAETVDITWDVMVPEEVNDCSL